MSILSKPYTFSPNTTISSSEMNANFDTLYNDYNGGISAANLADNAVTTAKIADLNVTTAKLADGSVTATKINLPSLQPEYFANTNSDTISVTPTRDGVIKVTHRRAGWGFAGGTFIWTINTPPGLTKVAGTNGYVTGGDTVGREMTAFGIYTNAEAGTQYNFSLITLQGANGGAVNDTRSFIVECYPA